MALVRQAPTFSRRRRATRFPAAATCVAIYSRVVNSEGAAQAIRWPTAYPWCAHLRSARCSDVRRLRRPRSRRSSVLDFDDLLLYWAAMLDDGPSSPHDVGATASITSWWTSTRTPIACRRRSFAPMKPDGRGVTVVGDDAQAIYGFRAATRPQHPGISTPVRPARLRRSPSSATIGPPRAILVHPMPSSPSRAERSPRICDQRTRSAAQRPLLVSVAGRSVRRRKYVAAHVLEQRGKRRRRSRTSRCCFARRRHSAPARARAHATAIFPS